VQKCQSRLRAQKDGAQRDYDENRNRSPKELVICSLPEWQWSDTESQTNEDKWEETGTDAESEQIYRQPYEPRRNEARPTPTGVFFNGSNHKLNALSRLTT